MCTNQQEGLRRDLCSCATFDEDQLLQDLIYTRTITNTPNGGADDIIDIVRKVIIPVQFVLAHMSKQTYPFHIQFQICINFNYTYIYKYIYNVQDMYMCA